MSFTGRPYWELLITWDDQKQLLTDRLIYRNLFIYSFHGGMDC